MVKRFIFVTWMAACMLLVPVWASSQEAAGKVVGNDQAWLGVYLRDYERSEGDVSQFGAQVEEVVKDSPAERAGLKEGDVIIKLASKTIRDAEDVTKDLKAMKSGDQVEMVVLRDKANITLKAKLGEREDREDREVGVSPRHRIMVKIGTPRLGVKVQDLSADLAGYFQVQAHQGVLVTEVEKESPAEKAGLKAGDVITEISGKKVAEVDDLHKYLRKMDDDDKATVGYVRKGRAAQVDVTLDEEDRGDRIFQFQMPDVFPFDGKSWEIYLDELREHEFDVRQKAGMAREKALRLKVERPERIEDLKWRSRDEMKELQEEMAQLKEELKKMKEELKSQLK